MRTVFEEIQRNRKNLTRFSKAQIYGYYKRKQQNLCNLFSPQLKWTGNSCQKQRCTYDKQTVQELFANLRNELSKKKNFDEALTNVNYEIKARAKWKKVNKGGDKGHDYYMDKLIKLRSFIEDNMKKEGRSKKRKLF